MSSPVPFCIGALTGLALAACAPAAPLPAATATASKPVDVTMPVPPEVSKPADVTVSLPPEASKLADVTVSLPPEVSKSTSVNLAVPGDATKLAPQPVGTIRYFVVSPDRKRVAYMPESPIGQLHVLTFGGGDVRLSDLKQDVAGLRWSADSSALLYQTEQRELIPGEFFDWDIPATRYLSTRLMRSRVSGGEPEILAETKAPTWFATGGPRVFYGLIDQFGVPATIQTVRLDTGAAETLSARPEGTVDVSPDGGMLAWSAGERAVRLYEVATGTQRSLEAANTGNLGWVTNDRLVITNHRGGSTFRVASRAGELGPEIAVGDGELGFGIDRVSPGGKWVIGPGRGQDPGAPIVSLETGKVYYSHSFAWRAWLDDETLLALNTDGMYAVSLARAINLP